MSGCGNCHGPLSNVSAGNNHAGNNATCGGGQWQAVPTHQHFEGETEALKGHIYDLVGSKSANLFIKTTKTVARYNGWTYSHRGNTWLRTSCTMFKI